MSLLSLQNIELAFGHVALLDKISLHVERGERIGLIGRNGAGKSSLMSLIAGSQKPDDGSITRASGVTTALVEQEPHLPPEMTVLEVVTSGLPAAAHIVAYERAATRVATDHSEEAMNELADLQSALDADNGWGAAHRLERVMEHFDLDREAMVSSLSGGQAKRVALARAMVTDPDLLLLDEPTNHLDIETIGWLEGLLREFAGSVLFITHDRSFLDAVTTRIVELDRGDLTSYPGSYAAYRTRKAEELEIERVDNAKFDKRLAQEEAWIREGVKARRTRNEGRVRRLEQLRVDRAARRERSKDVQLAVDTGARSGKLVAEMEHVTKSFGDGADRRVVIRDFTATIMRGDRVGLIGRNGAGKTTMLKLILGQIEPDEGTVKRGTMMSVAYFDQTRAVLDPEKTLLETISPGSEWIEIGEGANLQRKHVMSYLGDFLFAPERARSPVKSLSGGERNRLLLARLFARPANVLVLDEPTNDLDVDTLELLETLLVDYPGTIFLVSHDRAFLDNVVTQTIAYEGDGVWREYVGGYADTEAARARSKPVEAAAVKPAQVQKTNAPAAKAAPRNALGHKEQRELAGLPATIAALETEQTGIAQRLSDTALFRSDRSGAAALQKRATQIEQELATAMARWETLERLAANA
ncbi:MAG: ATP-binding cassette domain-containing protein [Burkholderiaceae bacterium]